jgi:hypothetical protein
MRNGACPTSAVWSAAERRTRRRCKTLGSAQQRDRRSRWTVSRLTKPMPRLLPQAQKTIDVREPVQSRNQRPGA